MFSFVLQKCMVQRVRKTAQVTAIPGAAQKRPQLIGQLQQKDLSYTQG